MAVDFNLPTVDTTYTAFPTQIIENIDAALQQLSVGSPSNVPTNAIKWDSSANRWKKYNGSAYVDLTGTYDLNADLSVNQLNLGDSERIRLGNNQDLQLYHNGSDSYVQDAGIGKLVLATNGASVNIFDTANTAFMAKFNTAGSTEFYNAGSKKFETSSAGATLTGDLTTSGSAFIGSQINLDGSAGGTRRIKVGQGRTANDYSFIDLIGDATYTTYGARFIRGNTGANAATSIQHRGTGALQLTAFDAAPINLLTSGTSRLYIESGGDVGIGLSNPAYKLHITSGNTNAFAIKTTVSGATMLLVDDDTTCKFSSVDGKLQLEADSQNAVGSSEIKFLIDNDIKFTMDSSGVITANKQEPT